MATASRPHAEPSHTRAAPPADVDRILALYRTHCTSLVRLAFLLLGDRDAAVEVVDEAFVQLERDRRRDAGAATVARLRALVLATARDRAPSPNAGAGVGSPDRSPAGRPMVVDAVCDLPHVQREALVMQYYGAFSDDDIAAATGAPIETVRASALDGLRAVQLATGGAGS